MKHKKGNGGSPRRQFLRVAGGAMAGAACAGLGCGRQTADELNGPVAAGNVSELTVGSWRALGDNAVIGRDTAGLFAMSTVCTHAACPANPVSSRVADGLYCDCHGSRFDGQGAVTRGPASRPLPHYRVDIAADGSLTVRGDVLVSADNRTAVP